CSACDTTTWACRRWWSTRCGDRRRPRAAYPPTPVADAEVADRCTARHDGPRAIRAHQTPGDDGPARPHVTSPRDPMPRPASARSRSVAPRRRALGALLVALLAASCGSPSAPDPTPPSPALAYLERMLDLMQQNSINR